MCSTVERMPRTPVLCLLGAAAFCLASCVNDAAPTTSGSDVVVAPGTTAPVPGSCDPDRQRLPAPSIIVDGTSTDSTFGIGAYECGTITGDGYIVYSFNPVLIDAKVSVQVRINSAATPELTWDLGSPFIESGENVWTSTASANGCARLTIDLTSPSGENTAKFGADIRVGGQSEPCPQRVVDPTDPGDIGSVPIDTLSPNRTPPSATSANEQPISSTKS